MRYAFLFLSDKIKECIDNKPLTEKYDILWKYLTIFLEQFKVMYMEATKLEEAFIIFETLNARGRELELADLLKNYIFSKSNDISEAQRLWDKMVDKLGRIEPTKFIRHYWNSGDEFKREKDLYRAITSKVIDNRRSSNLLKELEKYADYYHDMIEPEDSESFSDDDLIETLKNLKLLKASTFYPVVLAMCRREYSESDICIVVKRIETLIFRNFTVCGNNPNSMERVLAKLAYDIYNKKDFLIHDIVEMISNYIVDDDEFQRKLFMWSGSSSAQSKNIVRYFFRRIHVLEDLAMEININNSEVHIEHIMPLNNDLWKVEENIHKAYVWRLGNLMLLSGRSNKKISNKLFKEKIATYKDSKIEPNKEVANEHEWTCEKIERRQKELVNKALKIWKK